MIGRRLQARIGVLVAAAVCGSVLAGCGGSSNELTVRASFPDVEDLAVGAPVQYADVAVGSVAAIALKGGQAQVTLHVDPSAHVPADVTAEVTQTTVLGERIVALVRNGPASGLLADGTTITHTKVVGSLEQLVQGGSAVFGSLGANQISVLVQAGAQGFGQSGAQLRTLLDGFGQVLASYSHQDQTIRSLITGLDQLSSATAPDATGNAQAITNLATATNTLAQQSGRFNSLLASLDSLSTQGRSILESYTPQIDDQIAALRSVSGALSQSQGDLALLLKYLYGHNQTVHDATEGNFVQILNDIEVCGVPGGGESNTAVANCYDGTQK
ncbi:MAG TPA: MlaD family protein [Acidimicrobiales bacterium]|nr:MlaD family protein [Acidimicrobiales bacterium]